MTIKQIKQGLDQLKVSGLSITEAVKVINEYHNESILDSSYGDNPDIDMTLINCNKNTIDYTRQFYVYDEFGEITGGNSYKGIQLSAVMYFEENLNFPVNSKWMTSNTPSLNDIFISLGAMGVDISSGRVLLSEIKVNNF